MEASQVTFNGTLDCMPQSNCQQQSTHWFSKAATASYTENVLSLFKLWLIMPCFANLFLDVAGKLRSEQFKGMNETCHDVI